ncbi:MAG: hypothetical protein WC966_12315 [Bradymonadales bacterium]
MCELSVTEYLKSIRGDVFKILPMKEDQEQGEQNYLYKYIESLTFNLIGGLEQFEFLGREKQYIYAITNLRFLMHNDVDFLQWRRIVLTAVGGISTLYKKYGGEDDD